MVYFRPLVSLVETLKCLLPSGSLFLAGARLTWGEVGLGFKAPETRGLGECKCLGFRV